MRAGQVAMITLAGTLGACAAGDQRIPVLPEVVDATGGPGDTDVLDLSVGDDRVLVEVFRGEGVARTIAVQGYGVRAFDGSEHAVAEDAAAEAARQIGCGDTPLAVLDGTAKFHERGQPSAFTRGEAAWVFKARCG